MKSFQTCAALVWLLIAVGSADAADHGEAPKLDVETGHQVLKREVGTWDAEQKLFMDPNSPPIVSKGVETNEMLGEFWLIGNFESEMFGQSFHGRSQVGYDPKTKKFIGTWIDSMTPVLNRLEGTMEGNTLTMYSTGIDPATGKEIVTKMVSTFSDASHKAFVAYEPVPGKKDEWRKTMEVKYTRRAED